MDARTHQPVRLARVVLSGNIDTFGYADAAGVTTFDRLSAGVYQLDVTRAGYRAQQHVSVEAVDGSIVTVEVLLASAADMQFIGSVSTTTRTAIAPNDVQSTSVSTRLSKGLADALGTLPALSGAGGAFSIGGRNPLQTGYQIDGVAIPGLAASGGAGGIDPDLFAGASVVQGAENGSAGGTINFRTLDPTVAFRADGAVSYGSEDSSSALLSARGTIGYAGVVVAHASRGVNGPLNGLTFHDASGSRYLHNQGNEQHGDLVKVRVPFGTAQSLTGTVIHASARADIVCDRLVASEPCGFGPGLFGASDSQTNIVNYRLQTGNVTFGAGASTFVTRRVTDETRRRVNGILDPNSSSGRVHGSSVTVNGIAVAGAHHTIAVSGSTFQYQVNAQNGGSFPSAAAIGARYGRVEAQDVFDIGRATLSTVLGTSASTATHHRYLREVLRYAPARRNVYQLAVGAGEGGSAAATLPLNSDPASLVYDCAANVVFGQAAGDQVDEPTIREATLTWQHRGDRATFGASAYIQEQRGGTVATFVPGSAANTSSVLTPQYLAQVSAFFGTPAGCGRPAAIQPSQVLLYQSVATDSLVFSGAQASATTTVGRGLTLGAFAAYQRAAAYGSDSRFGGPASIVRIGAQLPNVAPFRATAIADYRMPRSTVEGLALLQFVAANNQNNLPSYLTLSLGAGIETPRATFTLSVRNVSNVHARTFVSAVDSVALPTAGGVGLPTLSSPLRSRELQASYTVRLGADRTVTRAAVDASLAGGGEDSIAVPVKELPATPLENALAPNLGDARCTPEALPALNQLYAVFHGAIDRAEAVRRQTGAYPDSLPIVVPAGVRASVSYVRTQRHVVLVFTAQGATLRAFSQCASVALTDPDSVRENDLATLTPDSSGSSPFGFSPQLGFYIEPGVRKILNTYGAGHIRAIGEPLADPFGLRAGCPSNFRPLAEAVIDRLRSRLGSPGGGAGADPPGVTIAEKSQGFSRWYEIQFSSVLQAAAFQSCVDVASGTAEDLRSRGFGTAPLPTINYAQPFGFYRIRP